MSLQLIKIDEREYWSDDVQDVTVAIYQYYVVDTFNPVRLCEITPSYSMYPVYVKAEFKENMYDRENTEVRDYYENIIEYEKNTEIDYMPCNRLDSYKGTDITNLIIARALENDSETLLENVEKLIEESDLEIIIEDSNNQ